MSVFCEERVVESEFLRLLRTELTKRQMPGVEWFRGVSVKMLTLG